VTTELNDFERLADVLERKLQVAARGPVEQQELLGRLVQIYSGPVPRPERARMLRERLAMIDLETTPMVPIPPPETRVGVPPIPEARPHDTSTEQAAAHAAAGKTAEAGGDLERAEQAYWRAASIEAEPALRANYLVAHARVLLARGDVQTARGQLEAARERAPWPCGRQRAAGRRELPNAGLDSARAISTRCSRRRRKPPTSSRAKSWSIAAPRSPIGRATRPRPRGCTESSRSSTPSTWARARRSPSWRARAAISRARCTAWKRSFA
jgi:tetratricopeptide (TPR) repeat protein